MKKNVVETILTHTLLVNFTIDYKMKCDILTEIVFSCQMYSNILFYLQLNIVKYYNSKLLFSILIY